MSIENKQYKPLYITPTQLEYDALGLGDLNQDVIITGIGKTKLTLALTKKLFTSGNKYDFITLIGFAGSLNPTKYKIGDVCVADKIFDDIDCRPLTNKVGDFPTNDIKYSTDDMNLCDFDFIETKVSILSTNKFITSKSQIPDGIDVDLIDMESSAFVEVCNHFKIPYLVIRIVSDYCNVNSATDFLNMKEK